MKHPSVNILRMGETEGNVTSIKITKEKKRLRKEKGRFKFPKWMKKGEKATVSKPMIGIGAKYYFLLAVSENKVKMH